MAPGHNEPGEPLFGRESLFRKKLNELRSTGRASQNEADKTARTKELEKTAYIEQVAGTISRADPHDLERVTLLDTLTELYNHSTILRVLRDEVKRAKRYRMALSVLMLTIDGFRDINIRYGPLASDSVLKGVANFVMTAIRDVDIPARYDSETFLIVCPNTDSAGIAVVADRIRNRIFLERVSEVGQNWSVTVSIGVASYPANGSKDDDLVKQARTALTDAEFAGGNRFIVAAASTDKE